MRNNKLAIVGSGPTSIYLLKKIFDNISHLRNEITHITIFEKSSTAGMGMPYHPETTDKYNLSNITSDEIPELPQSFGDWLRLQDDTVMEECNIDNLPIDNTAIYSRLALGRYFHEQYNTLVRELRKEGIIVTELTNHEVTDIISLKGEKKVTIETNNSKAEQYSRVVIATGHSWKEKDQPKKGYYASPWPIQKLIANDKRYNCRIGILGASLSAFDVVTSLAHRHGKFVKKEKGLLFIPNEDCMDFKIILHSSQGWLPNLQYEQEKSIREIYRHTTRDAILKLVDNKGFLNIHVYFNEVCRPALIEAFKKDENPDLIKLLEDPSIHFEDFISLMTQRREYIDSFLGMQREMELAEKAIENNKPTHWMETLDDLIYCLNFHVELLPAEDHLYFKKVIRPFLMNVIAAMPLCSASILLAMYDADCIDLVTGRVKVLDGYADDNKTLIEIDAKDETDTISAFDTFINCSGQNSLQFEDYPFPSMINLGAVRKARARFKKRTSFAEMQELVEDDKVFFDNNQAFLYTDGIDIDAAYRVIRHDGSIEPKIHDVTFTHTTGARPYSYGLQACNATSTILVDSWIELGKSKDKTSIEAITQLYESDEDL
ncbi:FAD/NAD(P)-binding protein [Flavobacterium algicola]|uniref:FAD/NAD(P)-binding protein n=1 Tax=Flavobacterium algicola TaxID=556529 RepID=UPI001EFEE584|nr:FAD/NAD(P)-binding protein [Flavobacterium algicola]MCG9791173.1 FAD/NAD(P)-binding protein [Flavobacterium algicola]